MLPVFAVLVEAGAKAIDVHGMLGMGVGSSQELVLALLAGGDSAVRSHDPHLWLQPVLVGGISGEDVLLLLCIGSHWFIIIMLRVWILGEAVGHALAERLGRIRRLIMHFQHRLLGHEVRLVVLLSLDGAAHVHLAAGVAQIGAAHELLIQSLRAHVFLDSINDFYNVLYVLLKLFAYLEAEHRDLLRLLVSQSVQVATLGLPSFWRRRVRARQLLPQLLLRARALRASLSGQSVPTLLSLPPDHLAAAASLASCLSIIVLISLRLLRLSSDFCLDLVELLHQLLLRWLRFEWSRRAAVCHQGPPTGSLS